jgi:hypothetical protein
MLSNIKVLTLLQSPCNSLYEPMGVKERKNVAAIDKADYLIKEKGHKQVTPSRRARVSTRTTTPRETWPLTNLWPLIVRPNRRDTNRPSEGDMNRRVKSQPPGDALPGCAGFFCSQDHLRGAAFLTSNQERWSCDVFFRCCPQLKESLNKFKGGALW